MTTFDFISDFLRAKRWIKHECLDCGRVFFSKYEHASEITPKCGWRKCKSYSKYEPKSSEKKRKIMPVSEVLRKFTPFFASQGLIEFSALKMTEADTDLVSAGVQVFNKEFRGKNTLERKVGIIAQPCVRTSKQDSMTSTSLSFVNICTESIRAGIEQHMQMIDAWLTFLSSLAIHMNHIRLVTRIKNEDWGFGNFSSVQIFFLYFGEELGEASYVDSIPHSDGTSLSDIGFGLERLTWGANKFQCDYFDLIGSPALKASERGQDTARTIALLLISGIIPGGSGARGNLRKIIKSSLASCSGIELIESVTHFVSFWKLFYAEIPDLSHIREVLQKEIDREKIQKLKELYRVNQDFNLVEICNHLMYNVGIPWKEIHQHCLS